MRKALAASIAALALTGFTSVASADEHGNGNSDAARGMADVVSGTPGLPSAASTISGQQNGAEPYDSGWDNVVGRPFGFGNQVSAADRGNGNGNGSR